jgi:hypothetical protein
VPWLLDGNNLAGGRDRDAVRRAALAVARREQVRILIFFDGAPPPGTGDTERLGAVEIRYVGHADDAIVGFLRSSGRGWRVATDDRALGVALRATGAEVVPASTFWAKAAVGGQGNAASGESAGKLAEEMAYFADPAHRLAAGPARIPRRRPRGKRSK